MSDRFSVVLSGGGCKAFWANGVLRSIAGVLPPIDHWAGASAGAAFAITHAAGRFEHAFDRFLVSVTSNQRNFYLDRALRRQRPFPHDEIYRDAVGVALRDPGFAQMQASGPVHILLSYVQPGEPFVSTSWDAVRAYADRRRRGVLHGPEALPRGVGVEVVSSHAATDVQELLDWALMSSTIPPITPIQRKAGRRYLDGGLIDNVPIRALPEQARGEGSKILCLISHHVRVPERPVPWPSGAQVLYLAASAPPPVRVWDYTSPERVLATIELGERDGAALRDKVIAFIDAPAPTAKMKTTLERLG